MNKTQFKKMHGLGNDFVLVDLMTQDIKINAEIIKELANRRYGIGCDQVLTISQTEDSSADFFMRIYNPDGTEAEACGNGTRSAAKLWMDQTGSTSCVIQTVSGILPCRLVDGDLVEVVMGEPKLNWNQIPLREEQDTLRLGVVNGDYDNPVAVNVGNPHTIFFVSDVLNVDVGMLGPQVENHVMFPARTNVEFAQVMPDNKIRVRVWERGTGITQACGSGACATIVAAVRRGLIDGRKAEIILDGGSLFLEWRANDNKIVMAGPASYVFDGIYGSGQYMDYHASRDAEIFAKPLTKQSSTATKRKSA